MLTVFNYNCCHTKSDIRFSLKSFSLVPSCVFPLLPVVRSDTCVTVRSVGGWIDLLCVHMATESGVGSLASCSPENTLVGW